MAGIATRIDVTDAAVRRALTEAKRRAADLRPAMQQVGEHMLRSVEENFRAEGRPERWQPLALATLFAGRKASIVGKRGRYKKSFEKGLQARKVLTRSARLRRSIAYRAGKDEVVVGTNVVYARIHQLGGQAGRGRKVTIPARPFLVVQSGDETAIVGILGDYVTGGA